MTNSLEQMIRCHDRIMRRPNTEYKYSDWVQSVLVILNGAGVLLVDESVDRMAFQFHYDEGETPAKTAKALIADLMR